jgi:hypothetical protein
MMSRRPRGADTRVCCAETHLGAFPVGANPSGTPFARAQESLLVPDPMGNPNCVPMSRDAADTSGLGRRGGMDWYENPPWGRRSPPALALVRSHVFFRVSAPRQEI